MNRAQAEQLLGGFAAGILTDSEKTLLFTAALDHQELFDALADEEALRELLADPEVRQQLIRCLAQPEPRRAVPLWRRPAFLGLAASLFVLVTTSLVVLRRPETLLNRASKEPEPPALTLEAPAAPKLQESMPASPVPLKAAPKRKTESGTQDARKLAAPAPAATGPAASADLSSDQELGKVEAKETIVAAVTAESRTRETKQALRAVKPVEAARAAKGAEVPMAYQAARPPLSCSLEPLGEGRIRLQVTWGPSGHLYVLQRASSGVLVLQPVQASSGQGGPRTTLFESLLRGQDVFDVYVLDAPASDPSSLPASGEIPGQRQRVRPE